MSEKINADKIIRPVRVYSDWAGRKRGGGLGLQALEWEALDLGSDFFERYPLTDVQVGKAVNEKNLEGLNNHALVYDSLMRLSSSVYELRKGGFFPVIISGDHSSSAGVLAGLKQAHPDSRIGVIYIDAHADIHSPYTSPSGNLHGMPLAMATGLDNQECAVRKLTGEARDEWKKFKEIGTAGPKVRPEDIVFCCVRSCEEPETELLKKHGIRNFRVNEINSKGHQETAAEIFRILEPCDLIYISFDVDSMDPSESTGTGTPEPEGLSFSTAMLLNEELIRNPKVSCWEITEINPLLDRYNRMAKLSLKIVENTVRNLIRFY